MDVRIDRARQDPQAAAVDDLTSGPFRYPAVAHVKVGLHEAVGREYVAALEEQLSRAGDLTS
jgi:hypothetical protein